MAQQELTIQFRAGALNGSTYQAVWPDDVTFATVVNGAAVALGASGASNPTLVTRNCTTDAESRSITPTSTLSTERATKWSIIVANYT